MIATMTSNAISRASVELVIWQAQLQDRPEMTQAPENNYAQAFPEVPAALLRFDHQAPLLRSGSPLGLGSDQ
jgi:hypothetical protein